jgi:outer membrane biogenesis lipoprotein LolB
MMSRHNAWRLVVAIFCVLIVTGCTIATKRNAQVSHDDYQACLAANPDNVQACEDKRLIMERDQREYERRCQWLPCF